MAELRWINSQVRASGCVCCHDTASSGRQAAVWDISAPGIWTDQLSDQGVAILSGKVSSEILGKFTAENNNGFSRDSTGFPTTDVPRVQQFFNNELTRRGVTDADIAAFDEFGYFLIDIIDTPPDNCTSEETIQADGKIYWTGGNARYVYVKEVGSKNPGVPPSNDNPEGVLWRLDVLANVAELSPGIVYGGNTRWNLSGYACRQCCAAGSRQRAEISTVCAAGYSPADLQLYIYCAIGLTHLALKA